MSALRSNYLRLALLPVLLTVSLLLPNLHLHPVYDHDHSGHLNQRAVIHVDFLSGSAQDHRHAQQENAAVGDVGPWAVSQSGLLALLARSVDSLLTGLEKSPEFLLVDIAVGRHTQPALFAHILKREQRLPVQQVLLAPNAPRSPPLLA
jgi:hypothetical protein